MPKCRENWRRKIKTRRRRCTIASQKILDSVPLRFGERPYYEAYNLHAKPIGKPMKRSGGLPSGGWHCTYKERLSKDGRDLYLQLMKMCQGVTVKIPRSVLDESST